MSGRPAVIRSVLGALVVLLFPVVAASQAAADLRAAVDEYLETVDDAAADRRLAAILAAAPDPAELLAAVTAAPPPFDGPFEFTVPVDGAPRTVVVKPPQGHRADAAPVPLALDVKLGRIPDVIFTPAAANVAVRGYDPERWRDAGRDGFLKILRVAAWRANADPNALWLTGFSWGAHHVFDTVLHRPGGVRGIVAFSGAPRRKHFRLVPNMAGLRILASCGKGDDAELRWNLRELGRIAPKRGIDYEYLVDDRLEGRLHLPLVGARRVGGFLSETAPREAEEAGVLLADGGLVENRELRILSVDAARVAVPERIAVSPRASPDAQRRKILRAMEKSVAKLTWKWKSRGRERLLVLGAQGVESVSVFLRASRLPVGTVFRVVGGPRRPAAPSAIDPRVLLTEARRTGDRHDPAYATVDVVFDRR